MLDGPRGNSSRALAAGYPVKPTQIHVPNFCPQDADALQLLQCCQVFRGTAHALLKAREPHWLRAAWLDYCCSFRGTTACSPEEDIALLFARGFQHTTVVFAIAVAQRGSSHRADIPLVLERVLEIASAHGFQLIEAPQGRKWKQSMHFLLVVFAYKPEAGAAAVVVNRDVEYFNLDVPQGRGWRTRIPSAI